MISSYKNSGELEYKIFNSIRCSPPNKLKHINDWRYSSNHAGWTFSFNISDLSFFGGSMSGVKNVDGYEAYVEQPVDKVSITPTVNRIDIIMRVNSRLSSQAKLQFIKSDNEDDTPETISSLEQEIIFDIINDGQYHVYRIDPNPVNSWQGEITRFRLFPFLDAGPGDTFNVQMFKVFSLSEEENCFCKVEDFFENVPSPCTGAGRAASIVSSTLPVEELEIDDTNNLFSININGFGFREVELRKTKNPVRIDFILEDLEKKINTISSSGCINARCYRNSDNKVVIEGGIRGSDTSIDITSSTPGLLYSLGFTDVYGHNIFTTYEGVDDSTEFSTIYELSNSSLRNIKDESYLNLVTFNSEQYLVEGGNVLFNLDNHANPYDARGKTLIDYLKPISSTGYLNKFFFFGTIFTSPQSKIKIYRPSSNNSLILVDEVVLEPEEILTGQKIQYPQIPLNQVVSTFSTDKDVLVRVGDYLAVTNVIVYGYSTFGDGFPVSFVEINSDDISYISDFAEYPVKGDGMRPLPLYARSDNRRERSSLLLDLGEVKAVDKVVFNYIPLESAKNSQSALSNSSTIEVDTKGSTHVHWRWAPTSAGLEQQTTTHTTSAINIDLLLDGNKSAFNGASSQYFYLDGDGEESNTDFTAPGLVDAKSFINDQFDISIVLSTEHEKEISLINLYFVSPINWVHYGVFYEKGGARIPFNLTGLQFDGRPIDTRSPFFMNPLIVDLDDDSSEEDRRFVGDVTGSATHKQITFLVEPVKTKKIVFEVYKHYSTKMTEIEVSSPQVVSDTGFEIKGEDLFDVYAADSSLDFEEFFFTTTDSLESKIVNTSYSVVGKPVRYILIDIKTPIVFDLLGVKVLSEKADIANPKQSPDYVSNTEFTNFFMSYDEEKTLTLINDTGKTADLTVDILRDTTLEKRNLVFWSKLNSIDSILYPSVGPGGIYNVDNDFYPKIRYDVAQNRSCYGTLNLQSYTGKSEWVNLGDSVTNEDSTDNISSAQSRIEQDLVNGTATYTGDVESGGFYNQTFDITYYIHIDTENGFYPDLGTGNVPTFTVTSSPQIDNVEDPIEILNTNIFYPVGTLGVLIKFNTFSSFGDDDVFVVSATTQPPENVGIHPSDYAYVAINLIQSFNIVETAIEQNSEQVQNNVYRSWSNDVENYSIVNSTQSDITGVGFPAFGSIEGPARWIMLKWDFNQGLPVGGYLNRVSAYIEEKIAYTNRWWSVSPITDGSIERDNYVFSSSNSDFSSTKFRYKAGQSNAVTFFVDTETIEPDVNWSFRDYVSFNIKFSQLDNLSSLVFRIGSTDYQYYEWSIDINLLSTSWVTIELPFMEAIIEGEPELYNIIGYVAFVVNGTSSAVDLVFNFDELRIVRNKFGTVCKFDKGFYLNNAEFVSFYPVDGLSLSKGCIEFWFLPDFNQDGYYEFNESAIDPLSLSTVREYKYYFTERVYSHTFLTLLSGFDFEATLGVQSSYRNLIFMTNNTDGDEVLTVNPVSFDWYEPHHLAVSWEYSQLSNFIRFKIFLDGVWVLDVKTPWINSVDNLVNVIIGGKGNPELYIIEPASASAVIENLKMYNFNKEDFYDKNSYLSSDNTSLINNELFLVSVNNESYDYYGAISFPKTIKNIANGDSVDLKFKYNKPSIKVPSSMPRRARVEAKWEIK